MSPLVAAIVGSLVGSAVGILSALICAASTESTAIRHRKKVDSLLGTLQQAANEQRDSLEKVFGEMTNQPDKYLVTVNETLEGIRSYTMKFQETLTAYGNRIDATEDRLRVIEVEKQQRAEAASRRFVAKKPIAKKPEQKSRSKSEARRLAVQKGSADKKV